MRRHPRSGLGSAPAETDSSDIPRMNRYQKLSLVPFGFSGNAEPRHRAQGPQSGFRPEDESNYQGANYGWQRYVAGLERVAGGLE
jgi:hypothetical protein